MVRTVLVPLLIAGLAAPGAAAQNAAPATSPTGAQSVLAPAAAAPTPSSSPRRSRVISGEAAAALAAFAPKYEPPPPPPPPKPVEEKPEEERPDLRDVDKPRNTIVRLPKYIVQEKKPPIFRERDIHTKKGLTEIAMRRYISEADRALNRWTIPIIGMSKEARALAMYAEDERLRNMEDLRDAANNAAKSDGAAGEYIRRESQETYLRSGDFGWSNRNK